MSDEDRKYCILIAADELNVLTFDSKSERDYYYDNAKIDDDYHKAEKVGGGVTIKDDKDCGKICPTKEMAIRSRTAMYQHIKFLVPVSELITKRINKFTFE